MTALSLAQLKSALHYNSDTGHFTWLTVAGWRVKVGDIAGCTTSGGYREIRYLDVLYKAHRLAWFYTHGAWPTGTIDHINHDTADNRLSNLRDVPHSENQLNRPKYRNNRSGHTGVYARGGKWGVFISVDRRRVHIGFYSQKHKAVAARKAAEIKYGYHQNHGV